MHWFQYIRLLMVFVFAFALVGCGSQRNPASATKNSPPLAPLIGEPCLVRVFSGKVSYIHLTDAFSPNEETVPKPGMRFIAVGFPIGAKQTKVTTHFLQPIAVALKV